jgi:hypothetical protein
MTLIDRLCDAALPGWPEIDPAARQRARDGAAGFVARELALAPAHIRVGIAVLGCAFRIALTLASGNADRAARLAPPLAKYWQLVRQLAMLGYLEQPEVLDAIGMAHGAARQADYRARRARAEAGL